MTRRRWPLALAAAGLLVLADAGIWYAAERALARGVGDWTGEMAAQGVVATAGPAELGGFPFAATRSFALTLAAGQAGLRSARVVLRVSPSAPGSLRIALPAPVMLSAPGLPPMALSSPDWRLDARLDGSGAVSSDARDLTVAITPADGAPRAVRLALMHMQAQPEAGMLDLVGSAQSVALPDPLPGEAWPLGTHIASVAFDALLRGRLPAPTPGAAAWPDAAALTAWRDGGGAIELRRLAVGYGPLGLSGQATVTLDQQLQPTGTAAMRVLGYAETLDALVAAHVVTAHTAQAAGAVLALLAQPPPGGGAPEVALDGVLRDRTLTVIGFPLLRLPMLAWPGG